MSDSVWPHRQQPTRLPCPWDSPGKNMSGLPFPSPMHESGKWKWSRSVVSNPQWPHGLQPPGSSVHGIFQARVLEWGAIAFSVFFFVFFCFFLLYKAIFSFWKLGCKNRGGVELFAYHSLSFDSIRFTSITRALGVFTPPQLLSNEHNIYSIL